MLGQERMLFDLPFLLCISIAILLFPVVISQIPLGSTISVMKNDDWVSSNGDFAIGFFYHSDQYVVGIRFNSKTIPIDKQTVVWVAGADISVGNKSYFQLTQNGELVLFDSMKGVIAWRSETSNSSVASAVLLDNGNLVLLNRKNDIVWQSFDNPSDTLLPGQNFTASRMLRAASRNSMSSYYSLEMAVSGQLQLRWESNVVYWTSQSPFQSNLRAIFNSEGILQILDQRSKSVWSVFGDDHNDSNVNFRFLRLDVDGNLRLYSWLEASRSWRSVWEAVGNQCNIFATCGLCGICVFNSSGSPVCRCPFTPTGESKLQCLVPYRQECKSGSSMITYEHTFLYGIYPPNETTSHHSLQQCKSLCQEDPLCTAVTFRTDGTAQCQMMATQYISGHSDPSLSSISFVKRCSDPIAVLPISPRPPSSSANDTTQNQSNDFCVPCLVGVASGTFVAFLVIQFGIGFCIYKRRHYIRKKAALAYTGPTSNCLIILSYPEIKDLTGNFKHQVGPKMFKGMLPDNRPVAVKELKTSIEERKFRSIVSKIGSIYHKSLVKLEGYCCESGHRFLIYEFANSGSLGNCIEDPKMCKRLTWGKRMEMCITVARAISYLHTECREFVSHGNLKCENVVLDENLEAKVSEFGLGLVCGEASYTGGAAEMDVGDFGKMVLVLVSGCREANDVCQLAYEKWAGGQAETFVDERIRGVNLDELERLLRIAFWCLQADNRMRPSMGEVIKVLEGTLTVDPPPPPFVSRSPPEEESDTEM
ncbi:G-type lectin S-receptor-like serine/threonine-protein kinase SD3-1 [Cornus florida]|uniref:G-type lectin S-receptor-like serine/threonine-protein kinase SD3-1 n=1 Tax=Cornus florida TaxID=4283 RepID=UPI00289A3E75|nr:G-type lectin S-receptor-like serine/threonine-protein kinase SD3-1 [Cornus florida]XP_059646312.1 G-type lectin S-receptor-like serine/threonine-protein kinase SD3-1 [Cornus florida]